MPWWDKVPQHAYQLVRQLTTSAQHDRAPLFWKRCCNLHVVAKVKHQSNVPMQCIQTRARQQHTQLSTVLLCGACIYDVSYSDFSFALVQHVPLQVYLAFGELVITWVCSWLFEWGQDILPPKPTVGPDLQLLCFLCSWETLWPSSTYWCAGIRGSKEAKQIKLALQRGKPWIKKGCVIGV